MGQRDSKRRRRMPVTATGLLVSLALGAFWIQPASAASQGSLGATSTGSISITLSVQPRVKISGLRDAALTVSDRSMAVADVQTVCVWSNTAGNAYSVTAAGSGPGGAFELSDGNRTVSYDVLWSSRVAETPVILSSGLASATNAGAKDYECKSQSEAARLEIRVEPAALQVTEPGATYGGSLSLLVSPQ